MQREKDVLSARTEGSYSVYVKITSPRIMERGIDRMQVMVAISTVLVKCDCQNSTEASSRAFVGPSSSQLCVTNT